MTPTSKSAIAFLLATTAFGASAQQPQISAARNPIDVSVDSYLDRLQLPGGFDVSIYARGMEEARSITMSDNGVLYVGTRGGEGDANIGKVYAIPDANGDGIGDEVITVIDDLYIPNGVAWHGGDLYVAEIGRVLVYRDADANLHNMPSPEVVSDATPETWHHGWKYIDIGPDNKLYVPVGAPCNICELEDLYGKILRMDLDGSNLEVFATGVRNTVGFTWHPETGDLWFTDNGRDVWGDDIPPEELNRATEPGQHFGFPHRYGKDLVDNEFPTDMPASAFTPAVLEMPAHNAGLGIEFYTGEQFPGLYQGQLFAAYHGSWNRNPPAGYKIRLMRFENGTAVSYEDFATGWLITDPNDSSRLVHWGRPVDLEIAKDGALLVSDDQNGVIYRISYSD